MGLIELYPDNANRARRAQELSDDCNIYFNELHDIAGQLQDAVDEYSATVKAMLIAKEIDPEDPALKPTVVDLSDGILATVFETGSDLILGVLTTDAVKTALLIRMAKSIDNIPVKGGGTVAGRTIVRQVGTELEYKGIQGLERIAIDKLKFPVWTRFKALGAGIGASIVIALAIDTIVEAFTGASTRSKLQQAIKGLYGPRLRLKAALLCNQDLLGIIHKTLGDMSDMSDPELGYTRNQLEHLLEKKAREARTKSHEEYERMAADSLRMLDVERGSFTDDDVLDDKALASAPSV